MSFNRITPNIEYMTYHFISFTIKLFKFVHDNIKYLPAVEHFRAEWEYIIYHLQGMDYALDLSIWHKSENFQMPANSNVPITFHSDGLAKMLTHNQ